METWFLENRHSIRLFRELDAFLGYISKKARFENGHSYKRSAVDGTHR